MNLSEGTRITISGNVIYGNNLWVFGDNNEVRGDNNHIKGSNNYVYGKGCNVSGRANVVFGERHFVVGTGWHNSVPYGNIVSLSGVSPVLKVVDMNKVMGIPVPELDKAKGDIICNEDEYTKKCVVCIEKLASCCILPCCHKIICVQCSRDYIEQVGSSVTCPNCRTPIQSIVYIFD